MIVYQTDAHGYFVAVATADPDPMVPNGWLIPSGCVAAPPPEPRDGQRARWNGDTWAIEVIPAPAPPNIADVRGAAVAAMSAWIGQFLSQFVGGVSAAELASWPVKAERARQHIAGDPQAMIVAEAALTGEDAGALAAKIVAKSDAYEAIISRVTGLRRATEAAIAAAETQDDVAAALTAARAQAEAMAAALGVGSANS